MDVFPGKVGRIYTKSEAMAASWGLLPHWAKSPKQGRGTYNARWETVAVKPTFRDAFVRRRCVVPADAFYERFEGRWLLCRAPDESELRMAGLYELPNRMTELPTFAVITMPPSAAVAAYHDRMPALLDDSAAQDWLDDQMKSEDLLELLSAGLEADLIVEDAGPIRLTEPSLFD